MIYLRSSVGVEIRHDALVLTCLKSNFSGGVFTHYKRVEGYKAREREEVRREIDQYFRTQGLSRDAIMVGIPRSDCLIRYLDLPKEVEDNLKQVVQYQVQSFEPSEDEKYCYDYLVMPSGPEAKRIQVALVMVRKSLLDAHLGVLRFLGIQPASVTVGSIALATLFSQSEGGLEGKTFLLADLRPAGGIEIVVLRKGFLAYLSAAVLSKGQTWKELIRQELDLAVSKVRLDPDESIERLVLAGEEAESLQRELREEFGDCDLISAHVRYEMAVGQGPHVVTGASSLGLATTGIVRGAPFAINLLPTEQRIQTTRWAMVPSVVLAAMLVMILSGFALRPIVQEGLLVNKLDEEIAALKARVQRIQNIKSQAASLEKQISYFEGIYRKSDCNLELLRELTTILPPDTFLGQYYYKEGVITLTGSSSSASDLIGTLEKSPLIKEVNQRGAIFKDAQTGKDRFNFEMKLENCR